MKQSEYLLAKQRNKQNCHYMESRDERLTNYCILLMFTLGLGTHLFVKYLDQETAKWPFRSSSQAPF